MTKVLMSVQESVYLSSSGLKIWRKLPAPTFSAFCLRRSASQISDSSTLDRIQTVNRAGMIPTKNITRHPKQDAYPAWSPDGAKIAFSSGGHIWVMNADGSGRHVISGTLDRPMVSAHELDWSGERDGTLSNRVRAIAESFAPDQAASR